MKRKFWFSMALSAAAMLAPATVWADEAEDHAMANQIAVALKESGKLKGYRIGVSCKDGTAWLEGDVTSNEQGVIALEIARNTEGVTKVVNRLMCPAPADTTAAATPDEDPTVAETTQATPASMRKDAPQPAVAEATFGELEQAQLTSNETGMTAQPEVGQPLAAQPTQQQMMMQQQAMQQQMMQQQAMQQQMMQQQMMAQRQPTRHAAMPRQAMPHHYQQTSATQPIPATPIAARGPAAIGHGAAGYVPTAHPAGAAMYDQPYMPNYSWPSYAAYPNYAAVTYPKQYSPTAWPYIGPFYPYPQVPLGWRKVTLEWDDGWWMLDFKD